MLKAGEFKRAEEEYSHIKRQAPNHPIGYVRLGAFYIAQHQWEKAIRELDHAVRIQPDVWMTSNDLATLLSEYGKGKDDLDRALTLAEKAKSLNPDNANISDTIGWIYYRKGDMKKAVDWLAKAQMKAPDNPVFNYHLGMAYHGAGNAAKAKEHLRIALNSKAKFPGKDEAGKTIARIP
jgi:tetratricopeptide (TPR) repeat protein